MHGGQKFQKKAEQTVRMDASWSLLRRYSWSGETRKNLKGFLLLFWIHYDLYDPVSPQIHGKQNQRRIIQMSWISKTGGSHPDRLLVLVKITPLSEQGAVREVRSKFRYI